MRRFSFITPNDNYWCFFGLAWPTLTIGIVPRFLKRPEYKEESWDEEKAEVLCSLDLIIGYVSWIKKAG